MNIEHIENLNTFEKLEKLGFDGPDACIRESLQEYGIAWLRMEEDTLFIYAINHDGTEYDRFDRCSFDNSLDLESELNWANLEDVSSFIGDDIKSIPLPYQIEALNSYYGMENVFGSSYWEGFSITE